MGSVNGSLVWWYRAASRSCRTAPLMAYLSARLLQPKSLTSNIKTHVLRTPAVVGEVCSTSLDPVRITHVGYSRTRIASFEYSSR